jgi:hypothetical protein
MTENLINIYVVWSYDGPIMTTLLQYPEDDMQRQAMQDWAVQDYVAQAFDAEFEDEHNAILNGDSYEVAAIFEAPTLHFIY